MGQYRPHVGANSQFGEIRYDHYNPHYLATADRYDCADFTARAMVSTPPNFRYNVGRARSDAPETLNDLTGGMGYEGECNAVRHPGPKMDGVALPMAVRIACPP